MPYSTSPDAPLAIAVQRALHHLARPWYRMRALRVFRDQTSLAAGPDLGLSIAAAIRTSGHFILLASPESAASRWVRHEIEVWRDRHQEGWKRSASARRRSSSVIWPMRSVIGPMSSVIRPSSKGSWRLAEHFRPRRRPSVTRSPRNPSG